MIPVGLNLKRVSFDAKVVVSAEERAAQRVLSKFGSFIRRTARQSIRKSKKSSAPGQPPRSHIGTLKRFLFFAYSSLSRSVVIGPAILQGKKQRQRPGVLEALEYGGTVVRRPRKRVTRKLAGEVTRRGRPTRPTRPKVFVQKARPFMGPAFRENQPKLDEMWRDSIR